MGPRPALTGAGRAPGLIAPGCTLRSGKAPPNETAQLFSSEQAGPEKTIPQPCPWALQTPHFPFKFSVLSPCLRIGPVAGNLRPPSLASPFTSLSHLLPSWVLTLLTLHHPSQWPPSLPTVSTPFLLTQKTPSEMHTGPVPAMELKVEVRSQNGPRPPQPPECSRPGKDEALVSSCPSEVGQDLERVGRWAEK